MALWVGDRPDLFDDAEAWDGLAATADARMKVRVVSALIAENTRSVVDVGCGNGLLVNSLPREMRVVGVDRSAAALEFVEREAVVASVTELPFEDDEFDTAVCSEVLEHLSKEDFQRAVAELKRVASMRLIITVPLDEDLWFSSTRCRACDTSYNRHGHQRSFTRKDIESQFGDWTAVAYAELGAVTPVVPRWLSRAHALVGNETVPATGSTCPRCRAVQRPGPPNALDRLHGRAVRVAAESDKSRPYWMLVMLQRRGVSNE